jgi:hypothetical protein
MSSESSIPLPLPLSLYAHSEAIILYNNKGKKRTTKEKTKVLRKISINSCLL